MTRTPGPTRKRISLDVDVHHLARVEGHGNIRVCVEDGELKHAAWEIVETPRFFEVMLKGKHYNSAGLLTARICGICSIGHCLASLRATEDAFDLTIPEAARLARLLAKHGETIQSHALHLFLLVAPDPLGLPSAVPLVTERPDVFRLARRLKGLGNHICDAVAGRTTHPVSLQVGGVARLPASGKLRALRQDLRDVGDELQRTVELFASLDLPRFTRETEFVALAGVEDYPWIGGRLRSTDGVERAEDEYRAMTNEYVTEANTSKWCKLSRESFAVGALARFNVNHGLLHPRAAAAAEQLGLAPVCHDPFMNNAAQVVEIVHVAQDAQRLIDELLALPADAPCRVEVTPRAGSGVGAIEVPRGILYHHLEYDDAGRVAAANCVIPTTQNNANIHHDLQQLARELAASDGITDERMEQVCSMLVRAYDPCISCSVH